MSQNIIKKINQKSKTKPRSEPKIKNVKESKTSQEARSEPKITNVKESEISQETAVSMPCGMSIILINPEEVPKFKVVDKTKKTNSKTIPRETTSVPSDMTNSKATPKSKATPINRKKETTSAKSKEKVEAMPTLVIEDKPQKTIKKRPFNDVDSRSPAEFIRLDPKIIQIINKAEENSREALGYAKETQELLKKVMKKLQDKSDDEDAGSCAEDEDANGKGRRKNKRNKPWYHDTIASIAAEILPENKFPSDRDIELVAKRQIKDLDSIKYNELVVKKGWQKFFKKYVLPQVLISIRKKRSYYNHNIKMALFSVFGSERLEKIDDNLKGADLTAWKKLPSTKSCRRNLITTMKDGKMTFMDAINRAVWKSEDQTSYNNAYAYAICDATLFLKRA